jgi:probable HAF family extracellular repeat protein
MTALNIGNGALAHAINDAGSVTGEFFATPGQFHAFLYRNGTVTDLGTLGGLQSFGNAINGANHVTGTADTANGGLRDAFLYAEGVMTDLRSLYGSGSAGYAINNEGQVVGLSRGSSSGASAQTTATMWNGAKIIDLNAALAHPLPDNELLVQAIGINDRGWIVANARAGNKVTAYLLTPVAPLVLACPAAAGEAGLPYSSALTAVGGIQPYSFSNTGKLPGGMVLNTNTGMVTGTPSEAGAFQLTTQVVDSLGAALGTATTNCTITIGAPVLQLRIFPERYSFGTVARFRPHHNTFTIMNTGARSVSISRPSIALGGGTHKGEFTATSLCGSSLAPGRSCRIDVVVFAHHVGPLSATLNLPNNAVGSPQTVPLNVTVTPLGR